MKILVAVPVFNEEQYAAKVMREIRKYARAAALNANLAEMRVLVLDDGSTDGTPAVLRDLAARGHIDLITHPENRGYGQSLIDAFRFAEQGGYDWVITMDCDEQHEPCRIPLFVRECIKDDADIISGSRYLRTDWDGNGSPPADRRSINRTITDLLNSTLSLNVLRGISAARGIGAARGISGARGIGVPPMSSEEGSDASEATSPRALWSSSFNSSTADEHRQDADATGLTDSFCGFKAHRVAAMARMNLTIPGYAFPMQFWAQAAALGLRIREIPVKLIYKDATRHFGGMLDDPSVRLRHYLTVLSDEIRATREAAVDCGTPGCCQDLSCAMVCE